MTSPNVLKLLSICCMILIIASMGCIDRNVSGTIIVGNNILSLDRESGVSGSFTLGSGSVKNAPSYLYYIKTSDGGYRLKSVDASKCIVYQDENVTPYIKSQYLRSDTLFRDMVYSERGNIGDNYIVRFINETGSYDWYELDGDVEIHIPFDGVVKEFKA